ncbi:MAG: translational GTPase TypA [Myxococcales bacterium FL481]|nr:MAG: translational GTPase TypA [Myxococcales bacterium FL481]
MTARTDARNVAIVAHVDHGKTTLVDALLAEAGAFRRGEVSRERAMDSGDLERERGITITSKPTALTYKDTRINLVDTPGHADFGGEVERVLNMVDAVLLLVDAFEGPMPQTRFVTEKAIKRGLKVLLVVNKVDRDGAQPHQAVDDCFDLLVSLGADEDQLEFPVVYCSARDRYAMADPADAQGPISLVLDMVLEHAPPPEVAGGTAPSMWVSTLHHDAFLGFLAIGRLHQGRVEVGDRLALCRPSRDPDAEPETREVFRVSKVLGFQGLRRFELGSAEAGDIVAIAGMSELSVGDTLTVEDPAQRHMFPALEVDPPTLAMRFRINDGPFAGTEGKWVTSRKIRERLGRETLSNVALQVNDTDESDEFEVRGRGELHLSVLIETMRREGYELCVSRPRVLFGQDEQGNRTEPYENVSIDLDSSYTGAVIDKLSRRGGVLGNMSETPDGRARLEFSIPTRGLIGYRSELMTDTRGTATMSSVFDHYGPYNGPRKTRQNGVLIVMDRGETTAYSLFRLQDRGALMIGPQTPVYPGLVMGVHNRDNDIVVNPCAGKKLTNVRASGADEKLILTPPRQLSLEQAMTFIEDDELLEVTPVALRVRKRYLDHNERKRMEKRAAEA